MIDFGVRVTRITSAMGLDDYAAIQLMLDRLNRNEYPSTCAHAEAEWIKSTEEDSSLTLEQMCMRLRDAAVAEPGKQHSVASGHAVALAATKPRNNNSNGARRVAAIAQEADETDRDVSIAAAAIAPAAAAARSDPPSAPRT